jgi:hypothetical protein
MGSQQDGDGIVVAGVAVEYDFVFHALLLSDGYEVRLYEMKCI